MLNPHSWVHGVLLYSGTFSKARALQIYLENPAGCSLRRNLPEQYDLYGRIGNLGRRHAWYVRSIHVDLQDSAK